MLSLWIVINPLAVADVKSLTSNELTETYIEDSTIIVTPAQTETPKQTQRMITYTIDPAAPLKDPAEEHAEVLKDNEVRRSIVANAEENARHLFLQSTVINDQRQPVEIPEISNRELNLPNVPPIELPLGPGVQ